MLAYFLYTLFILSCVVLVLSVLLQPGKADAGALFTSSVSSATFGPRGTQTILAKITIIAAIMFMLTALAISFGLGGSRSVLEGESDVAAPAATPQAQPSPAASITTATPDQSGGAATASPEAGATQSATPASSPAASPAVTTSSP